MQSSPLTPTDLLLHAGPVVKTVLITLALMSVWSWAIILRCAIGYARLRYVATAFSKTDGRDTILDAGRREASIRLDGETRGEQWHRVSAGMRRRIHEIVELRQSGLGSLAVISSVSPFIGLLGTVWGIMESFIGIAAAKDTSLAVVAPGIAEALAATAVGLVVAIPAAFAYNRYASAFSGVTRRLIRAAESQSTTILQHSHHG
jgi:biopolymer transport protein ExbB/TolQ